MKLFCCGKCNQIFNLTHEYQECRGGHGGGQYIGPVDAKVWGDLTHIFVLGFANTSFIRALREQLEHGDKAADDGFHWGSRMLGAKPMGREFTAFVIPKKAESVIRVKDRFEPYEGLAQTMGGKNA